MKHAKYLKKRSRKSLLVTLTVLVVLSAGLLGGMAWFLNTHFFVGGRAYPKDADTLDLRNKTLTVQDYEQIRKKLPEAEIRWNVPFQNTAYPEDTTSISIRSLSDTDLDRLAYLTELKTVDAVGCQDYEQLMALRERYPEIELAYTVTIGGKDYAQDAKVVACDSLTDGEIALMAYLPELRSVDASGCADYSRLGVLAEAYPDLDISYQVELLGQTFTEETVSAVFDDPDVGVLMEELAYVSHLESVHLVEPAASPEALRQLMEAYPDITITWDKTVLGKTFNSAETEYDLSDLDLSETSSPRWSEKSMDAAETASITEMVEEAMAYFPNAEKVILPAYCFDNKTMAAFREEMRPEYKVVWTVYVTKKPIRTDSTVIHSSALHVCFIDEQSYDLEYCEDAIVVDIGHSYVKYVEWVKGMPNLQYLILADNWLKDITPLSTCKKLIYLELFDNKYIPDYSPLLGCTALQDLNISETFADLEPLKQMTWLNNLWANMCGITTAEHNALQEALPNTTVMTRGGVHNGGGWRQLQNYFDMRDIMGLPYNAW